MLVHNKCLGGSFKEVNLGKSAGEIGYHIPQNAFNKTIGVSIGDGSALLMSIDDHMLTRTFKGKGNTTMKSDVLLDAFERLELDIQDIQTLFGSKYDDVLYEVWLYAHNSGVY